MKKEKEVVGLDILGMYMGCEFQYDGTKDNSRLKLDPTALEIIEFENDYPFVKLVLRSFDYLLDEEVIKIANLALCYELEDPRIYKYKDCGIDCIAVTNGPVGQIECYNDLSKLNTDWVEIDSGFSVRVIHNTLCNYHEITKYMIKKQFDVFGLIKKGLSIDRKYESSQKI